VRVGLRQRGLIALAGLALATALAGAAPLPSVDALATDDPVALAEAVSAIERAPATPELADALFGAARACEDRLLDPARALALYERILRELPGSRVAMAAERRAAQLRAEVGPNHEYAREAAELARLIASADKLPLDDLLGRADVLVTEAWPGAPDVLLWTADLLRRTAHYRLAQPRYAEVARRWPATPQAATALRGGAGNAIDAGDWALAEELVRALPVADPMDRAVHDDLLADLAAGRRSARTHLGAWLALVLAALGLVGSLVEACLRGGARRPALRPPVEVMFLAPVGALLIAVAYGARAVIAPAVAQIILGGIAFTWLSGTTLELLRARGRSVRARALAQVAACVIGALAIGYLAIVRGGLLDLFAETIHGGPN
jgi:hypothetical protein